MAAEGGRTGVNLPRGLHRVEVKFNIGMETPFSGTICSEEELMRF